MRGRLVRLGAACAAMVVTSACASAGMRPSDVATDAGAPFRIAVFGDAPYGDRSEARYEGEQRAFRALLDSLRRRDLAFVVHVGDFTGKTCSDSVYDLRRREFDALPHPVVYTPGDNEWTDCRRDGFDALERLARLRRTFHAGNTSVGGRPMPLERQSDDARHAAFRENVRWRRGGVLFATLHVVGSNDNWGTEDTASAEFTARREANLAWLREAFAAAEREGARAVVIFQQANPRFERRGPNQQTPSRQDAYGTLRTELRRLAVAFGRPVLVVHGDSHYWRVDLPMEDAAGRVVPNVTRAETFGDPNVGAMIITVDPRERRPFGFAPLLVPRDGEGKEER